MIITKDSIEVCDECDYELQVFGIYIQGIREVKLCKKHLRQLGEEIQEELKE